ncbi:radical SAM protein [Pyxidicoccus sp. MSG2]|uniref:radical SAM protein n=1 Tax=Pyxidicoccus sp. MSG2 TaxID=2996790 RepID=UPI00226DF801|nr:radical SAM protein [Pyxidicoccus sp. MSG2]MCY1014430.1 radical SAM protein [Pyxidicoccus sp. MSG2]
MPAPGLPRFKSLLVSVTEACNVGCAHCGFIGSKRDREAEPEELADWVGQACDYGVPTIIFTGGEPFMRFAALKQSVARAAERGAGVGCFTSSNWGTSPEAARDMLRQLPGLTHLYLSSDVFHQRRVPYQNVYNVIEAAFEQGVKTITICITYTNTQELEAVRAEYARYARRVRFYEERVIPNPYFAARVLRNQSSLRAPTPEEYECSCWTGTPMVNPDGDVFSCHIAKAAAHHDFREVPHYLGSLRELGFQALMERASQRADYQFLRTHGPRGVAELFKRNPDLIQAVHSPGRSGFTNGCDMCFSVLATEAGRTALKEHLASRGVQESIDIRLTLQLGEAPMAESIPAAPNPTGTS